AEEKQPKKIVETEEQEESILAFEGNEGEESHPTIKIDCEKCGHDEAIWWMLQTRSADEPTTQFYRCTKCQYTWRNYA
ncbi:MAG: RPA12/RPB9/RPC11 RNA polymerase family protein, partial [Nitrosopumilus sp.]